MSATPIAPAPMKKCPNCRGKGELNHAATGVYMLPCRACGGTGKVRAPRSRPEPDRAEKKS